MVQNPPRDRPWEELDRLFTYCRRQLSAKPEWRYGPTRVHEVAKEGFDGVSKFTTLKNKVYCDLGCGNYHPFGVSAVMFLNGAGSTIALDLQDCDKHRAAEALADLLCDCCCTNRWNWTGVDKLDFLNKVQQFDIDALQEGRLEEGLAGLPLRRILTDIHNPILEENSIDIMTSRAVLEHFLNFGVAVERLFALMRKGGVACHHIDLVDHRAYVNPNYHYWSFLAEDDAWSDGLVNRLRSCEIRPYFERAGFEILHYENRIGKMPDGFITQVAGRFPCHSCLRIP
ncbi:MAG: methyltransferase domain-containing protein [Desulfobacterales bacterium]